MKEKHPRTRHRFSFLGTTEKDDRKITTTDQILNSLNRQAQPSRGSPAERENTPNEDAEIEDFSGSSTASNKAKARQWIFAIFISGGVVGLWFFGLIPGILYADTVGSVEYLVSRTPFIDIITIVAIWVIALVIGLIARRARRD